MLRVLPRFVHNLQTNLPPENARTFVACDLGGFDCPVHFTNLLHHLRCRCLYEYGEGFSRHRLESRFCHIWRLFAFRRQT